MGGDRRKFFVCGNWKMNGDKASIDGIVSFLNSAPLDPDAEVIVAVPAVYLDYVRGRLPQGVSVAAQGRWVQQSNRSDFKSESGRISPKLTGFATEFWSDLAKTVLNPIQTTPPSKHD